jgi:LruC domain-containing protein
MSKLHSGFIQLPLFAASLLLLLVACKPDPPVAERRFEDMSVPQSFTWSQIRNLVISVNMSGGNGQVFDLLDNQNRRIDRQLIREGRAVFNVRVNAETVALKVKSPVTGQEISFPTDNTTINFNLDSVAALAWDTATDTDGDSIPDNWDDFPNDDLLAFSLKLPYIGNHYVLFDEGWPNEGNFDYNDVVLSHQFELYYSAKRILRAGKGRLKVISYGLSSDYGLGVEYLRTVAGTTFDYAFDQTIQFTSGIDTTLEKDFNTIRFFNSFTGWMGIPYANDGAGPTATPKEIEYTFTWNANIGGNFLWPNFFLFKTNDRSFEVHAFGYPPTRLVNLSNLSTGDDASIRRWNWSTNFTFPNAFYRSYKNLPWGFEFFGESYAGTRDGFQVSQAYPFIVRWVETGGFSNRSWLQFPDNSRIFRLP